MNMVRVLILGAVAAMLAGCVSPSHSMKDSEQYYAGSRTYVRSAYYDAGWYPWWSMDYFYLGSHRYRPGYGSSFSFGLYSGYPYYDPWFFPGYYSAWSAPYRFYDPWYGGYYGRGFGYSRYDPYWRYGYGGHDDRSPRDEYSGGDYSGGRHPGYRRSREDDRLGRSDQGGLERPGTARSVSVAPSSGSTDRSKIIINRGYGKVGPSRTEPVSGNEVLRAPAPSPAARAYPGSAVAPSGRSNSDNAARPARQYTVPARPPAPKSGNEDSSPRGKRGIRKPA